MTSSPYLRTPWHWNRRPFQAQSYLKLKQSLMTLKSNWLTIWCKQCPIWHSLLFLSLHYGTHCGFQASLNVIAITPLIPLTTISSTFYDPRTISFGRGNHGSQEGNTLCQVEEGITTLLDHLLSGPNRSGFATKVDWGLVIDPNPQDMFIMTWPKQGVWCNSGGTSFQACLKWS